MNIVRMLLCLVALTPGVALSQEYRGDRDRNSRHHDRDDRRDDRREHPRRRGIPEFDPATAGAIAAVIAGGGVMLARRRAKK